MKAGKASTVLVTVGLLGTEVTQVTGGLTVGDQVVLADLAQPLPSSSTNDTGSFRFGGGFGAGGAVRTFGTAGGR